MTAKVKICGLSEAKTMQAALDHSADMVGLVFFAKSPRNVSLGQAKALAEQARGKAKIVALVVDADNKLLDAIAREIHPDYFQAHGNETPTRVSEISNHSGIPVIKAIKVKDAADITNARSFRNIASLLLYEAKAPETLVNALPGGNGITFDWNLLANMQGQFMLSGGLTPENVVEAIRITHAPIVDVSSGVESAPGVKDSGLIAKFIAAAKSA
jgi:phosphoribosylanthranilate isomerase